MANKIMSQPLQSANDLNQLSTKLPRLSKEHTIYDDLMLIYRKSQKIERFAIEESKHVHSEIMVLLNNEPENRTGKIMKKIQSSLAGLKYFSALNTSNSGLADAGYKQKKEIISLIAPFIKVQKFPKSAILEQTGHPRCQARILLQGSVLIYEPTSKQALKKCITRHQTGEFPDMMDTLSRRDTLKKTLNPEKDETVSNSALSKQQCRQILMRNGILTHSSPHQLTNRIQPGELISCVSQPSFMQLTDCYHCTSICAQDTICLTVDFEIVTQIIQHVSCNEERACIQSLLVSLPMLRYIEARKLARKDRIIADNSRTWVNKIREQGYKVETPFEISIKGGLYLVVQGSVRFAIDLISEKNYSGISHILPRKCVKSKEFFEIYENQVFGFEQIGKSKNMHLRYLAKPSTKILKLDYNYLATNIQKRQQFLKAYQNMKEKRNQTVSKIIKTMATNLQRQQLLHGQITAPIRYLSSDHLSETVEKMIKQNSNNHGRRLSMGLIEEVGLNLQYSTQIVKKSQCQAIINGGWIEVTDIEGNFLRKKRLEANQSHSKALLRQIGALTPKQIVDFNFKIIRKRKSKYQLEDFNSHHKQMRRLSMKSRSLPKLDNFYAKKQEKIYQNLNRKKLVL